MKNESEQNKMLPLRHENIPTDTISRIITQLEDTLRDKNQDREPTIDEVLEKLAEHNINLSELYIERLLLFRTIKKYEDELQAIKSKKEEAKSIYRSASEELVQQITKKARRYLTNLFQSLNACQKTEVLLQVDAFVNELTCEIVEECSEKILPSLDDEIAAWIHLEKKEISVSVKLEDLKQKIDILDFYAYNTNQKYFLYTKEKDGKDKKEEV